MERLSPIQVLRVVTSGKKMILIEDNLIQNPKTTPKTNYKKIRSRYHIEIVQWFIFRRCIQSMYNKTLMLHVNASLKRKIIARLTCIFSGVGLTSLLNNNVLAASCYKMFSLLY